MPSLFNDGRIQEIIRDTSELYTRRQARPEEPRRRANRLTRTRLSRHTTVAYHTGKSIRGVAGWSVRVVLLIVGGAMVLVGMLFGLTLVGSACGLPLILVGVVLFVRGLV